MNQNQNAQCCNLTDEDRMQDMLAQEKIFDVHVFRVFA